MNLFSIPNRPEVYSLEDGIVTLMPFKRKSDPVRHAIRKVLNK